MVLYGTHKNTKSKHSEDMLEFVNQTVTSECDSHELKPAIHDNNDPSRVQLCKNLQCVCAQLLVINAAYVQLPVNTYLSVILQDRNNSEDACIMYACIHMYTLYTYFKTYRTSLLFVACTMETHDQISRPRGGGVDYYQFNVFK